MKTCSKSDVMISAFLLACFARTEATPMIVALDWRCVDTPLCPNLNPKPLDLSLFAVTGGGTLADRRIEFMDAVRDRVETTLNGAGVAVRVEHAAEADAETNVRLSQEIGKKDEIGRAHYDPQNKYHGDEVIIFGEQIRRMAGDYLFDDWVAVFANVCSHETLHTLGYGHVPRAECPPDGSSTELMLDAHTMNEMRREQRILCSRNEDTGEDK